MVKKSVKTKKKKSGSKGSSVSKKSRVAKKKKSLGSVLKKEELHHLPPFWEKVEHYNSMLIPPAILGLGAIIIAELFFHPESHFWQEVIHIGDMIIIAIFVIDLAFIYYHVRNWVIFFKRFWLDILAVFPFILFFRAAGSVFRFFRIAEQFIIGQTLLHESLEVRKAVAASKAQKFAKYLRLGARGIRIVSKSKFFQAFRSPVRRK